MPCSHIIIIILCGMYVCGITYQYQSGVSSVAIVIVIEHDGNTGIIITNNE